MTILRTMRNFSSMNITASILLFLAAISAAIIANSSVAPVYQEFLSHELHLQIGNFNLLSHGVENLRMIEFINDGLMTIFFLLGGLEIKRELLVGELSSFRKAALPFIAACGGMLLTVMIYTLICVQGSEGGHDLIVMCNFSYSLDGKKYESLGVPFQAREGQWIGAKVGMFCTRPAINTNVGGWADVDWFRITKK